MVTKQELFATEQEATERGEKWKECWGYGYFGQYRVWEDKDSGQWVCHMTRWDSCD